MIVPKVFSIKLWTLTKNRLVFASSGPLERWDLRITQLGSGTWDLGQLINGYSSLVIVGLDAAELLVVAAMRKDPTACKNGSNP